MWITEDNQLNSKGFCANEFDAECLFEPDYSKNCHLYSFKNTLNFIMKYKNTLGTVISNFIEQLPENMEKAKNIIESFDPEKMGELTNFAKGFQNLVLTTEE